MTPNKNFDTTKEQQEGMFNKYALVLTSVKGIGVKTFSYLIPDEMKTLIKIGQPVLVPFGRMGLINAFVTGFTNYLPEGIRAKKSQKSLIQPRFLISIISNSLNGQQITTFAPYKTLSNALFP